MTLETPIWLLAIAPPVFGSIGFLLCAMFTAGKVADAAANDEMLEVMTRRGVAVALDLVEAQGAHARATDALATKQARIDRALACETPKAAHGVKKMAAILRGEA